MNKTIVGLVCALLVTTVASGDEPAKKDRQRGKNNGVAAILRQLKSVDLTEDQTEKIKAMSAKMMAEMKAAREKVGLTQEILKKRTEAQKELRESGKKQGEIFALANEKAGLSKDQVEVFKKSNQMRTKVIKEAVAMLTDDQKAKLPEQITKMLKRAEKAEGKGKGKKRKQDADKA